MNRSRTQFALPIIVAVALATTAGCSAQTPSPSSVASSESSVAPSVAATSAPPVATPSPVGFAPGTAANPRVVTMTTDDLLNFTPGVVVIAEGETVTFQIHNLGKAEHEFKVGPAKAVFADEESAPEVAGIKTGKVASLTYTFKGPGPFAFACHFPGHFEHGMKGYIIVVGPDVPKVGTAAQPRLVHIDMTDQLMFEPQTLAVAQGETVSFILTNSGRAVIHEFAVGPIGPVYGDEVDGKVVMEADELDPGSTHVLTYTFSGTGPFGYACHEPGHFEAGMKGMITVGT